MNNNSNQNYGALGNVSSNAPHVSLEFDSEDEKELPIVEYAHIQQIERRKQIIQKCINISNNSNCQCAAITCFILTFSLAWTGFCFWAFRI